MAESNDNPPQKSTSNSQADAVPTRPEMDEAIDTALAAETRRTAGEPRSSDIPFKRQWDAELEAELEATLSGFDPKSIEVASPRALEPIANARRPSGPNVGKKADRGPAPVR